MASNDLVAPTITNASSARAPHMSFQRFNEVSGRVESQLSTTASVFGQQRDASFPPERAPADPFTIMALPPNPLSLGAKLPSLKQGESMAPLPQQRHASEAKQLAKLETSGLQNLQNFYSGMLKSTQLPPLIPPNFGLGVTEQNPASLANLGSSIDQHRGIDAPPVTSFEMDLPSGQLLPSRVQVQGVSTSQEQAQMNEIMQCRRKEAEGGSSDWFSTLERHFPPPG
jgi:hypothetical protein